MGFTDVKSIEQYWNLPQPTEIKRSQEGTYTVLKMDLSEQGSDMSEADDGVGVEDDKKAEVEPQADTDDNSLVPNGVRFTHEEWKILLEKVRMHPQAFSNSFTQLKQHNPQLTVHTNRGSIWFP